jgi:ribosome-binding protein aMBF1 (putative translation factor)
MRRILRKRQLTTRQAAKYETIRDHVVKELPEQFRRHEKRKADGERLQALLHEVLEQLQAARRKQGLSLADLTELTGMDRSALSKLETGQRPNPTVETLSRYAEAVGKHLVVTLLDANDF